VLPTPSFFPPVRLIPGDVISPNIRPDPSNVEALPGAAPACRDGYAIAKQQGKPNLRKHTKPL
jgi:hypothetical protein